MDKSEMYLAFPAKHGKFEGLNVVVVSTIRDKVGNFGRGVAVCSPSDEPGPDGTLWAERYAKHALKKRKCKPISDPRAIRMLLKTDCPFVMQSELNPVLTFQEMAFFFGKRKFSQIVDFNRGNNSKSNCGSLLVTVATGGFFSYGN